MFLRLETLSFLSSKIIVILMFKVELKLETWELAGILLRKGVQLKR